MCGRLRWAVLGMSMGLLAAVGMSDAHADLGSVFAGFASTIQSQLLSVLGPVLGVVALLLSAALGISIFLWLVKKIG